MRVDLRDSVQASVRTMATRYGDRAIQKDDRCRFEFVEIVEDLNGLRPIGIGIARRVCMNRGNLRLKVVRGDLLAGCGRTEVTHAQSDQLPVPKLAMLFREYCECSIFECARRQTSGLQHHQRE